jgi:hypothetical protein
LRESYLRVRFLREGVEYIVGLEMRAGDALGDLRTLIKVRMKAIVANILPGKYDDNANAMFGVLDKYWPDRMAFIEVGSDTDSWVQVFDRRGVFHDKQLASAG